jgi:hypothetical protein
MMKPTNSNRTQRGIGRWLRLIAGGAVLGVVLSFLPIPWLSWVPVAVTQRLDLPLAAAEGAPTDAGPLPVDGPRRAASNDNVKQFSLIGVNTQHATDKPLYLRTRSGSEWSAWRTLSVDADEGPDLGSAEAKHARHATEGIWVGAAEGFEVNVPADAGSAQVMVVRDEQRATTARAESAAGAATAPVINSRATWGARPMNGTPSYGSTLKLGVVHHSASANTYNPGDVPGILRGIQAYHMDSNGWSDIGYNFVVDRFGTAWEGRAGGINLLPVGAHAAGFNTNTTGVMVLGTFSADAPTPASLQTVGDLLGWKMWLHGTDPSTPAVSYTSGGSPKFAAGVTVTLPRIIGHRDVGLTDCPGQLLWNALDTIRSAAATGAAALSAERPGTAPTGDAVVTWENTIVVRGTVTDADQPGALRVEMLIDNNNVGATNTDNAGRYQVSYTPGPGGHTVCVVARGLGGGGDTTLPCGYVDVPAPPPPPDPPPPPLPPPPLSNAFGRFDRLGVSRRNVTITGFAGDSIDRNAQTIVWVVADGRWILLRANQLRPWYNYFFGGGDNHGFRATITLPRGVRTVCAAAFTADVKRLAPLGCQQVRLR